jgi:hypothetical protein
MAERCFVVEVERLDAEVLVLDGLDLPEPSSPGTSAPNLAATTRWSAQRAHTRSSTLTYHGEQDHARP